MISSAVTLFFEAIDLMILIVVFLSWIPIFDEKKEPLATLMKIYNLIMAPLKAIIPPIGMFDISPVIAFILLEFIKQAIVKALIMHGL